MIAQLQVPATVTPDERGSGRRAIVTQKVAYTSDTKVFAGSQLLGIVTSANGKWYTDCLAHSFESFPSLESAIDALVQEVDRVLRTSTGKSSSFLTELATGCPF